MKDIEQALVRHLYAIIEQAEIGRILINGEESMADSNTEAKVEHLWQRIKNKALEPLDKIRVDDFSTTHIEFD